MRGYKTLKARFPIVAGPPSADNFFMEVVFGKSTQISAPDHALFKLYTGAPGGSERCIYAFDTTLDTVDQLIEFLDVAVQEQRRRIARGTAISPLAPTNDPPLAPRIARHEINSTRIYCDICNGAYPAGDVAWRPDLQLYVCQRNYGEWSHGATISMQLSGTQLRWQLPELALRALAIERGERLTEVVPEGGMQ